jgi:hypothetical protein
MIVNIPEIDVDGEKISVGVASLAVSESVALRVVPVDSEEVEHPEATITVVGKSSDVEELLTVVKTAVEDLLEKRAN